MVVFPCISSHSAAFREGEAGRGRSADRSSASQRAFNCILLKTGETGQSVTSSLLDNFSPNPGSSNRNAPTGQA
ncbi:hypothetical protein SRHO_G00211370 [Serrasalmus rhombeus]